MGVLQASQLTNPPIAAGGAGAEVSYRFGGEGGGSIAIYAKGNFTIAQGASIHANGNSGMNSTSSGDTGGAGGGGGGIVIVAAKGTMTISGSIRANGGSGSPGINNVVGGLGSGGGGGGGGGIIHLITATTPAITGNLEVLGGSAGMSIFEGSSTNSGGGGGASGGNGGDGGSSVGAQYLSSQSGRTGLILQTIVSAPENLLK
ncbi:hypothetical protein DL346_02135 [Paenibacillus montanisoli]|uniref:Uncharacterized protein n=1 Tax=Paenibacillus montanisoli TaxID=2081970 RepID=A0A328U3B9_9BACL|nr:hypothetical protein DL346_02135 [Paenibacillus montanisoli]